jgi:membrane protein implicated in regulation of membrane protease activity
MEAVARGRCGTGALPKWLGYVMILLGVVALTPIGWAAAIGTAILVLVLNILLSARGLLPHERTDRPCHGLTQ